MKVVKSLHSSKVLNVYLYFKSNTLAVLELFLIKKYFSRRWGLAVPLSRSVLATKSLHGEGTHSSKLDLVQDFFGFKTAVSTLS